MAVPKLYAVVIAGAMAVGAGAVALNLQGTDASTVPFTVAPLRVGDEFVFRSYYVDEHGVEGNDTGLRWTYTVGAPTTAFDALRYEHAAIPMYMTLARPEHSLEMTSIVSLHTGFQIQNEATHEYALGDGFGTTVAFQRDVAPLLGTALQGATFTPGEPYEYPLRWYGLPWMTAASGGGSSGGGLILESRTFGQPEVHTTFKPELQGDAPIVASAEVLDRAPIDGVRAVTLTFDDARAHDHFYLRYPASMGGAYHVPAGFAVSAMEETWVEGIPVPVERRQQTEYHFNNGTTRAYTTGTQLVAFTPGGAVVPWTDAAPTRLDVEMIPSASTHPQDGTGSSLAYPLSLAIAHVEQYGVMTNSGTDVFPAIYDLGGNILGAEMTRGGTSWAGIATTEWRILVDSIFRVDEYRTEWHPDWPVPIVEHIGEADVPWTMFNRGTGIQTTIADAERVWRAVSGLPSDQTPTYIHWGAWPEWFRTTTLCGGGSGFGNSDSPTPDDDMLTIVVGDSNHGPCRGDESTYRLDATIVRADTGMIAGRAILEYTSQYQ